MEWSKVFFGVFTISIIISLAGGKMVDLTHYLNKDSRHFQLFRGFNLSVAVSKPLGTKGQVFLLAKDIAMSEHTSTHIDAPIHSHPNTLFLHQLPLKDLMGPLVVFDVTKQAENDPDYVLSIDDIEEHEKTFGAIDRGSICLIYTRGGEVYRNVTEYYGTNTPDDLTTMHFPGFGENTTKWLIENRKIKGIGTDRMSFDAGSSLEYPSHYQTSIRNVWGLENINRMWELPARGAVGFVMPVPIENATGGPIRFMAFTALEDLPFYTKMVSTSNRVHTDLFLMLLAIAIVTM